MIVNLIAISLLIGGRDSPSLNRNEDGWNQVSSKNNRSLQPVDPSRLKITKVFFALTIESLSVLLCYSIVSLLQLTTAYDLCQSFMKCPYHSSLSGFFARKLLLQSFSCFYSVT